MNKQKLVVAIMGQDCEKFIGMCLEPLKDEVDAIVYCDGGSKDKTLDIVKKFSDDNGFNQTQTISGNVICGPVFEGIQNKFNQDDKAMNGKQRNFYLKHLKENYKDYWCLVLDADEVIEDVSQIKKFIDMVEPEAEDILFNVHMRHLIGNLSYEDATFQQHFVPHRLFKIRDNLEYTEVEHSLLHCGKETRDANIATTTIWHLSYISGMWDIKKKYENHVKKSNMHTPEFLRNWYFMHLFGEYPVRKFNPFELPATILNNFGIDKDELYFANRGVETKHFIDAKHWKDFFKCKSVLEFGCGRGPRIFAMKTIGLNSLGVEKSEFACNNSFDKQLVQKGDIRTFNEPVGNFDLTVAYDVLEHLDYDDLDAAIITLRVFSNKYILVSVPYKGTPNCENDSTHIIKEDRDWWVKKFTNLKLKEVEVPEHFLFRDQLLIFKK